MDKRDYFNISSNLADIAWWIKGYIAASKEEFNSCPFDSDHYESLRQAIILFKDKNDEIKKEQIK